MESLISIFDTKKINSIFNEITQQPQKIPSTLKDDKLPLTIENWEPNIGLKGGIERQK